MNREKKEVKYMFVEELAEIRKCEDKADEIKKQSKKRRL